MCKSFLFPIHVTGVCVCVCVCVCAFTLYTYVYVIWPASLGMPWAVAKDALGCSYGCPGL